MANLSDAFGTVYVEKVGKEFIDFLRGVQGSDEKAYYKLVEVDDLAQSAHAVDEDGNLSMNFSTMGRWNYGSNIEGYLQGKWVNEGEDKKAYDKFVDALVEKKGTVSIEYTDSDTASNWMGRGFFVMDGTSGEVEFRDQWEDEPMNIAKYAELNGYSPIEALENLHGDEAADAYEKYQDECKEKGEVAVDIDTWYDELYEQE